MDIPSNARTTTAELEAAVLVWQEARRQARALVDDHSRTGDPFELCDQLGIVVRTGPLPPNVSGMIVKESGRDATIYLSEDDSANRRRFTCAHELGHYIERTVVGRDGDFSFRDLRSPGKYDLHEFFADEFAGELLMPAKSFGIDLDNDVPIARLAVTYGVSVAAAEKRRDSLRRFREPAHG